VILAPSSIVVIGASAGGVVALRSLISQFNPEWPVATFITLHSGKHRSLMPQLLNWHSPVRACFAQDDKPFGRGIYVAPPDKHLLIGDSTTTLSSGPKENHTRPAIDPMFRSAAYHHGSRVIGVLLTGYLFDGMNGIYEIHRHGGTTIVQDPADAEVPDIPANALTRLRPDYVLPLADIPRAVAEQLQRQRSMEARSVL
jgi:two-component system, chemotaxis family, protein-glutamate methylesterase/glutaminase